MNNTSSIRLTTPFRQEEAAPRTDGTSARAGTCPRFGTVRNFGDPSRAAASTLLERYFMMRWFPPSAMYLQQAQ